MVICENQEEIDYYWDKLSSVPEAEQCGWVKDNLDCLGKFTYKYE